MTDPDRLLGRLVDLIYQGVSTKRWLYWPPGPMMGQVFDREQCRRDIWELLVKELGTPEQKS